MSPLSRSFWLAAIALVGLMAGCANPRRPPGGPRDETPPAVVFSEPPAEATSVSPDEIRIRFSEYVRPSSFAGAFSLTPALPEGRPEFDWSGRTVTISLPGALRDSTTYIASIGADLQDVHGVSLDAPITLAFATGPQINKGRLAGNVVNAARGKPQAKIDVFAYAAPDSAHLDSLPGAPAYRTQTGSDGHFDLTYLREQPYFIVALRDQNGNRQPDPGEPFAVPPQPVLFADTLARQQRDTLRWIMTQRDERPPVAQRVRVQSRRRLRLSFNEAVRLTNRAPAAWPLTDSLAATSESIRQVYMRAESPRRVTLTTADTLRSHPYWLVPGGAADSSGHSARRDTLRFDPSGAPPDTLQLHFGGFLPERRGGASTLVLGPSQDIALRFNQPPPDSLRAFVTIAGLVRADTTRADSAAIDSIADAIGAQRSFLAETDDGTAYRLHLDAPWPSDSVLAVRVMLPNRPDTTYRQRYRRISERELGGVLGTVLGTVQSPDTARAGAPVLEITPSEETTSAAPRAVTREAGKQFAVKRLPAGDYRVRIFWDQNGNGTWDGGRLVPYEAPEPVRWLDESIHVRARWDTELDTLRLDG